MKRVSFLPDPALFILALIATFLGALAVYDAGYVRALQSSSLPFPREFKSHLLFGGLGVFLCVICSRIPAKTWRASAIFLFGLSLVALAAVLHPALGVEINGARRWLELGPISLQPAEFVKLGVILFLAGVFATHQPGKKAQAQPRDWTEALDKVWLPKLRRALPLIWVLVAIFLIEKEPDLGTAAIVGAVAFAMLVLAGVSARSLMLLTLMSCLGLVLLAMKEPYRMERITNHAHRWEETRIDDIGYQSTQSEIAMASGGWVGVGVASGRAKHVLPVATSDFIMTTIAEELGFWGSIGVLVLIGCIVFRLLVLSKAAASGFSRLVLGGVAVWIGVQATVNLMMASGLLPPIGIPMPFISAGGSSLLTLWLALGVCQATIKEPREEETNSATRRDRRWDRRARLSRA